MGAKITDRKFRMTQTQYNSYMAELKERVEEIRPKVSENTAAAGEWGDLRENAAWDSSIELERANENRIRELTNMLENAEIIPEEKGEDVVDVNDIVTAEIDGVKKEFKLKSVDSPIGRVIYGKPAGYEGIVETPNKPQSIEILEIKKV